MLDMDTGMDITGESVIDGATPENTETTGMGSKRDRQEVKMETLLRHIENMRTQCARDPEYKKNLFGTLTHDQCSNRHDILEPVVLEVQCPLDNGRHDSPKALALANSASLGSLDRLPLEVLHEIFYEHTAISTLTRCRAVNRGLRMVIDNIPQYKAIVTHAPSSLRAVISLMAAHLTSLSEMYVALCSKDCTTCGKFGAFLFVPNCDRVCYNCFTTNNMYLPIKWTHAQHKYLVKLADLHVHGAAMIRTIPGKYGKDMKRVRTKLDLVPIFDAGICGAIVHGSISAMIELTRERQGQRWDKYLAKLDLWEATPENQRSGRAPALPPFGGYHDAHSMNPHRFMCIVGLPWLDRSRGVTEWGVACKGCRISPRKLISKNFLKHIEASNVLYSEDSYMDHFEKCKKAQRILLRAPKPLLAHVQKEGM